MNKHPGLYGYSGKITTIIDHGNTIPAEQRTGSATVSLAMLCKQDKEQMDRIEAMLNKLLEKQE